MEKDALKELSYHDLMELYKAVTEELQRRHQEALIILREYPYC